MSLQEFPGICVCEVNRRWPNSYASRVELLQELVHRRMLATEQKCHLTFVRPIAGEPPMKMSLRELRNRWTESCQARIDMMMELTARGFVICEGVETSSGTQASWNAKPRVWRRMQ